MLKVYFVNNNESSIESAAGRASYFLKGKTAYDFWPDKADELDREAGFVQKQIDQRQALDHMLKTGEHKLLYK